MSRDIRSYFMGGAAKKASSRIEDDESPRSNKTKIISDKGGRKKHKLIIIDSDSEEDKLTPSPKRQKRSSSLDKKKDAGCKSSPNLVPVNIADVFGNKPVERSESKLQKKTRASKDVTLKDEKIGGALPGETDNSRFHSQSPSNQSKKSDSLKKEVKSPKTKTPIKSSESVHSKAKSPLCENEDIVNLDDELESGIEQVSVKKGSKYDKRKRGVTEESGMHDVSMENMVKSPEQSVASVSKKEGKDSPSSVGKKVTPHKKLVKQEEEVEDKGLDYSDKKSRAAMYQKYLHREGPKHPGSKEIPEGHPTCLSGLVFVVTGVMDSLDRDEANALIQRCGGKVTSSLSKNTSYIVLGEDPGPSKVEKAKRLGTKQLDEDGLLDLVRSRTKEMEDSGSTSSSKDNNKNVEIHKRGKNDKEKVESCPAKIPRLSEEMDKEKKPLISRKLHYMSQSCILPSLPIVKGDTSSYAKSENVAIVPKEEIHSEKSGKAPQKQDYTMWVDKYKPTTTKSIIGQQGEKSNVNKLIRWLSNWEKYHGPGGKRPPRPGPWDKNDDGGYYKAALLSGPPGIGKTTSAHLVCDELGRDAIELNASDTRSKRLLEGEVSELTTNYSLASYFKNDTPVGKGAKNNINNKKKVLLMDEVDGMAGNEDRGGVAALIQLIKETRIPIICMCNDRAHPKIRSLVGYCYDLRFQRPRMEQIRGAMMSICFKEGLKVSSEALADLITSTNQDVRQVLHQLNMWSANQSHCQNKRETSARKGNHSLKDVRLGPWDVLRKVFSPEERRNTTINQQADLFFYDYSLGPLFVFENYPKVSPMAARNAKQRLSLLAKTTESLAMGDIIQNVIRKDNAWKLLPSQAIFSSVIPGSLLEGHLTGQIDFPAFLGKTSTKGKMERLAQEISLHTRITTKATKESIKLDYLTYLRNAIIQPLVEESQNKVEAPGAGVQKSLQVMRGYNLLREDLDSILELSHFPGDPDPMAAVQSKVKAAFTRAYNKDVLMTPYSVTMVVKKKKGASSADDFYGEDEEEEDDAAEEDTIDMDAMIKVKKGGAGGGAGTRGGRGGAAAGGSGTRGGRGRGGRDKGSGDGTSVKRGKGRGKC